MANPSGDRPPDGWEAVDSSLGDRLTVGMETVLLRLTHAAARGTSRRQFLSRTGGVGLALGLTSGAVLFRAERARAHGLSCEGQSACGPSPLCSSLYCTGAECAYGRADTARRTYATSYCSAQAPRCWYEHCCNQDYNGHAWCCDCCAPSSGGQCLTNNCNKKCICRERIDSC